MLVACLYIGQAASAATASRLLDAALAALKEYRTAESTGTDVVSSLANLGHRIHLLRTACTPASNVHGPSLAAVEGAFPACVALTVQSHCRELERTLANLRLVLRHLEDLARDLRCVCVAVRVCE